MKLVDTSSYWVEYLRGSGGPAADEVEVLLLTDQAGFCEIIAAELWNGVRQEDEGRRIEQIHQAAQMFSITGEVWAKSYALAAACRAKGVTAPLPDIVISACAVHYCLEIARRDGHFDSILPIAQAIFLNGESHS